MLDFRMNLRRKDKPRKSKEKIKSNKWWLRLPTLLLRIKKNKSKLKIKKWWNILRTNWEKKNKMNKEEKENKKNKRKRWENILTNKSMRKNRDKLLRNKLMKNKLKFGNKTHIISLIMRKRKQIIWSKSINNMKMYWRLKWMIRMLRKIERKWTHYSYYTIKPWWKLPLKRTKMLRKVKFDHSDNRIIFKFGVS